MKVSDVRNNLSHMKVSNDLNLTDQTTDGYFKDISDMVQQINHTHRQLFTDDVSTKVLQKLKDVSELVFSLPVATRISFVRRQCINE